MVSVDCDAVPAAIPELAVPCPTGPAWARNAGAMAVASARAANPAARGGNILAIPPDVRPKNNQPSCDMCCRESAVGALNWMRALIQTPDAVPKWQRHNQT